MHELLKRFGRSESGATSIEYSLIAAFIGIAIITVVSQLGNEINDTFKDVEKGLEKRPAT